MKLFAKLPLLSCCLVMAVGCSHRSALRPLDLGVVEPGVDLYPTIELTNPFDAPAVISGIDGACGVRVLNARNGVLAAGERVRLNLLSKAQRLPGPGGFKIDLSVAAGKRKRDSTYIFTYSVRPHPFLDKSQVWMVDSAASEVKVFGSDNDAKITVQPPPGVTCEVVGRSVVFRGVPEQGLGPAIALISVANSAVPLHIDVLRGIDPILPRTYPARVWIAQTSEEVELVNGAPGLTVRAIPSGDLSVTIHQEKIKITRRNRRPLSGKIQVLDPQGRIVSTCTVVGPAMEQVQ